MSEKSIVYYRNVRDLVRPHLSIISKSLPNSECKVWGEVLSTSPWKDSLYCTIRDSTELTSVNVKLSRTSSVEVGQYILVHGLITLNEKNQEKKKGITSLLVEGSVVQVRSSHRIQDLKEKIVNLQQKYSAKELPTNPFHNIALVVGQTSMAHKDFSKSKGPHIRVRDFRANFNDAKSISDAVKKAMNGDCDIVVVTRGGGDRLDFAVFDDAQVLETIASAAARIPLVLALGHAADTFEIDCLVSKVCTTPSAAGAFLKSTQKSNWYSHQSREISERAKSQSERSRPNAIHALDKGIESKAFQLQELANSVQLRKRELADLQNEITSELEARDIAKDSPTARPSSTLKSWRVFLLILLVGVILGLWLSHAVNT